MTKVLSFRHGPEFVFTLQYTEKLLVIKETIESGFPSPTAHIWEAVNSNNIQAAYRLFVASDANPNITYDEVNSGDLCHIAETQDILDGHCTERKQYDPALCPRIIDSGEPANCLQGCSLLHLACHIGDPVMLELLLQFGVDINARDFHGRTPLRHCISKRNNELAKYLLKK